MDVVKRGQGRGFCGKGRPPPAETEAEVQGRKVAQFRQKTARRAQLALAHHEGVFKGDLEAPSPLRERMRGGNALIQRMYLTPTVEDAAQMTHAARRSIPRRRQQERTDPRKVRLSGEA